MTEPSDTPRDETIGDQPEGDAPTLPEVEPAPLYPDPVTAPNTDPATMSEHVRNARLAEQYGQGGA